MSRQWMARWKKKIDKTDALEPKILARISAHGHLVKPEPTPGTPKKEGHFSSYSMGAPAGGEGDGGQLRLGLFGAINAAKGARKWYRCR